MPAFAWMFERLPRVVPASWRQIERRGDGAMYVQSATRLSLIVAGEEHDGRRWLHMSMAHPDRLPTWPELVDAKEIFVGREEYAVQVIPPRSRYVNQHPFCLHLFTCVDGHPLPDFTGGRGTL